MKEGQVKKGDPVMGTVRGGGSDGRPVKGSRESVSGGGESVKRVPIKGDQ